MHFNFFSYTFCLPSIDAVVVTHWNAEPINRASSLPFRANAKCEASRNWCNAIDDECWQLRWRRRNTRYKWIIIFASIFFLCFSSFLFNFAAFDSVKRMNVFLAECNFYVIACELMIYYESYSRTRACHTVCVWEREYCVWKDKSPISVLLLQKQGAQPKPQ